MDERAGPGGAQVLYLPVASRTGIPSGPLAAGVPYQVTITGTVSLWRSLHWASLCAGTTLPRPQFRSRGPSGPVGVDAEWIWAWPNDSDSLCPRGAPVGPSPRRRRLIVFQPQVGAPIQSLPPPLETAMTPTHSYTYAITGSGTPVVFAVDDSPIEDNYGVLQIRIAPQQPIAPEVGSGG